jgi:hypothetical protein
VLERHEILSLPEIIATQATPAAELPPIADEATPSDHHEYYYVGLATAAVAVEQRRAVVADTDAVLSAAPAVPFELQLPELAVSTEVATWQATCELLGDLLPDPADLAALTSEAAVALLTPRMAAHITGLLQLAGWRQPQEALLRLIEDHGLVQVVQLVAKAVRAGGNYDRQPDAAALAPLGVASPGIDDHSLLAIYFGSLLRGHQLLFAVLGGHSFGKMPY